MALVILVCTNIASLSAISWQLLKKSFYSLKKQFPQIERFENGFEKSSLIWNFFPRFWLKTPCFPWLEKVFKISLISLIGGNPGLTELLNIAPRWYELIPSLLNDLLSKGPLTLSISITGALSIEILLWLYCLDFLIKQTSCSKNGL